jgi:hypothetical protein
MAKMMYPETERQNYVPKLTENIYFSIIITSKRLAIPAAAILLACCGSPQIRPSEGTTMISRNEK